MDSEKLKKPLLRVVEKISGVGFFFVTASVLYFIIGSVVSLVNGEMLEWTFCGSVRRALGVNWCEYEPHMPWSWGDKFVHQFLNAPVPFVTIVLGLLILAISLPLMNMLGYKYERRSNKDQ